jgi:hypothetical protein
MSLQKTAITVGGGSLQVYLKDGNNLHTEFVEEWIVIEDQNLIRNTNYFWRLSDRNFNVRLVSLWATTTGQINLTLQNRGTVLFTLAISNTSAASGFVFPPVVISSKKDLVISGAQDITRLFMTAKEVSICETIVLSRS